MKQWRVIRIGGFFFIVAFLMAMLACDRMISGAARGRIFDDVHAIPHKRVGLVLGTGRKFSDGRQNLFFKRRLEASARLYAAGKVDYLLVSGDNSSRYHDEPSDMKRDLIVLGVPAGKIYCDYAGFRTLDSVKRAEQVFGLSTCTIISQRFHCERAIFLSDMRMSEAIGFAADDVTGRDAIRTAIRERFARVLAVLDAYVWFRGPKFLGKQIVIGADPPS